MRESHLLALVVVDALSENMTLATAQPLPPSVATTPTGLDLPEDLSFDAWQGIGQNFGVALQAAAWCIGDWLVYGERKWGKQLLMDGEEFDAAAGRVPAAAYDAAINSTSLDRSTLKSYASVCRSIPKVERCEALTFTHHAALAPLQREQRDKWLKVVAQQPSPPSVKRLRMSMRIAGATPRIVTDEEITKRGEHSGHDNYIPHLTKLLTALRKTVPNMNEEQREALKEDTEQLVEFLKAV
jgi:hypothetical protein